MRGWSFSGPPWLQRRDPCAATTEATLSEFTRVTFRTHTPVGRVAFSAALGIGASWYWRHILKPIVKELS